MSREIYVIAHNMRSTFNVGSLLRTCEGLGISKVYLTGYTPYPLKPGDSRLPHESAKLTKQINKTALGAESYVSWEQIDDIQELFKRLSEQAIPVMALEQSDRSVILTEYKAPDRLALLLGEEVNGIPADVLEQIDTHLEIPMHGQKESFNVVIAAAMALYELCYH